MIDIISTIINILIISIIVFQIYEIATMYPKIKKNNSKKKKKKRSRSTTPVRKSKISKHSK